MDFKLARAFCATVYSLCEGKARLTQEWIMRKYSLSRFVKQAIRGARFLLAKLLAFSGASRTGLDTDASGSAQLHATLPLWRQIWAEYWRWPVDAWEKRAPLHSKLSGFFTLSNARASGVGVKSLVLLLCKIGTIFCVGKSSVEELN
jgi:hypothetical protein